MGHQRSNVRAVQKYFARMGFVLRHRIKSELERAKVDSANIVVRVERATVFVEGEMASLSDCVAIVAILRNIPGVAEVVDNLQVKSASPANYRYAPLGKESLDEVMRDYFGDDTSWKS